MSFLFSLIYLLAVEGATSNNKMIYANGDSDYSSSDEDYTPQVHFKLPECTLPDFLDTPKKWSTWAFKQIVLPLWCDLMLKNRKFTALCISLMRRQVLSFKVWLKMSCMFID